VGAGRPLGYLILRQASQSTYKRAGGPFVFDVAAGGSSSAAASVMSANETLTWALHATPSPSVKRRLGDLSRRGRRDRQLFIYMTN
jgi:hypothetical protein